MIDKGRGYILWEGPCAYVVRVGSSYEIIVFSSNHVNHVMVRELTEGDRAEQICRRLNAYPKHTRNAYGLL